MNTFLQAIWLVVLFGGHPVTLYPVESEDFVMRRGYYNDDIVRYVPFAASNMKLARQLDQFARIRHDEPGTGPVEWVPALECALDKQDLLGDAYMINCGQCVVFSTQPGEPDYTPLWRVHYLEWKPGLPDICLTNEADVLAAIAAGDLVEIIPESVMNATIIIPTSGVPSVALAELDYSEDEVEFYAFPVFYSPGYRYYRTTEHILITDVSDQDTAAAVGANWSPNLVNASADCCGSIYAFVNPVPPGQLPIISEVPYDGYSCVNPNKVYSPILCWSLLDRGSLPPYAVIGNKRVVDWLLTAGVISQIPHGPIVSNSPVSMVESDG